jgi:predicted amidohydrolase
MQAPVTISLAQCDAVLGDVERNLDDHLRRIEAARAAGAGLVVFPELSLTGYSLRDLTPEVALRADAAPLARLARASRGIDIAAGWIDESPEHVLTNAAGYFSSGRLLHLHRKVYPVNYGMFEERRYWGAGDRVAAFDTRWGRVGLLICEDQWHPSTSWLLFADRADVIITLSASPARGVLRADPADAADPAEPADRGNRADRAGGGLAPASSRTWEALLRQQSAALALWNVYVNRVGVEDGTSFAGGSRAIDPFGEVVAALGLGDAQECVTLEPAPLARRRVQNPMLRDERLDVTLGNLQRIVRDRLGD